LLENLLNSAIELVLKIKEALDETPLAANARADLLSK
jgi:hypothetical protein